MLVSRETSSPEKGAAGSGVLPIQIPDDTWIGESEAMTNPANLGFGLYIHWPFCQSKCPYCDFNSHVAASTDQTRWKTAYLSEIERASRETSGQILQSVFFGGGTPSLMDPDLIAAILDKVRASWPMSNDPEITLEANPTSVEAGRFAAYRQAGVNRVSVGVQALSNDALRQLGRMHTVKEAIQAIEIAQSTFPRYNFDLIYARQGQDLASWANELSLALSLAPRHLSLYQLTIEEGTVFHERNRRGLLTGLPNEDLGADLYQLTQQICEDAGLPAYEVSNHATSGEESRHNLTYWRGGDYIGIGPGAHGRLTIGGDRVATEAPRMPGEWLTSVETRGSGELPRHLLSPEEAGTEYCLMGLRLKEGISMSQYERLSGGGLDQAKLAALSGENLVLAEADRLRATSSGMLVLNGILRDLMVTG
jgi:putative oxygen-independent coproporphyrinogen III oxidase